MFTIHTAKQTKFKKKTFFTVDIADITPTEACDDLGTFGKMLSNNCYHKPCFSHYFWLCTDIENDDEFYRPEIFESLNTTLKSLGQSPVSKSKVKRSKTYSIRKHGKASNALKSSFDAVLSQDTNSQKYESAGDEMIRQLKEKFRITNKACDKIQILSVLPKSWGVQQIQSELN